MKCECARAAKPRERIRISWGGGEGTVSPTKRSPKKGVVVLESAFQFGAFGAGARGIP